MCTLGFSHDCSVSPMLLLKLLMSPLCSSLILPQIVSMRDSCMLLQGCGVSSSHHRRSGSSRQQRRRRRQNPQQGQGPWVRGHAVAGAAPARQPQRCALPMSLASLTRKAVLRQLGFRCSVCLDGIFRYVRVFRTAEVHCGGAVFLQRSCTRQCRAQQSRRPMS